MCELTIAELEAETVDMLPAREALGVYRFTVNGADIQALNSSAALNVGSFGSQAISGAGQSIVVVQH
jgi:hypothetical protein